MGQTYIKVNVNGALQGGWDEVRYVPVSAVTGLVVKGDKTQVHYMWLGSHHYADSDREPEDLLTAISPSPVVVHLGRP